MTRFTASMDARSEQPERRIWRFVGYDEPNYTYAPGGVGTRLDFVTFHAKGAGYRREPAAPKQTPSTSALGGHVVAGLDIVSERVGGGRPARQSEPAVPKHRALRELLRKRGLPAARAWE